LKFAILGAGAIGAYIGARMALAGRDVTLFARGPHLAAMQKYGIRVRATGSELHARPVVTGHLEDIGRVDVVFLAVKAHGLTELAPRIGPLLGPDTVVVSMQNGVPWWYLPLERVDPGEKIAAAIEERRVVASIVYFSTEVIEPGVIQHIEGNRISLGEPGGGRSDRCRSISEALIAAGLRCPVTTHIREEIWVKILGNVAFNPISALTGATIGQMLRDPEVAALVRNIMTEAECISQRMGMTLPVTIDQRITGAAKVGEHKTSMLQDLESGRPLELEAIVGAVVELGEKLEVPVPHTRAIYACTKLLESLRRHSAAV